MKYKAIVAFEDESSTTTRLTPYDIGVLLSNVTLDRLDQVIAGYFSNDKFRPEIYIEKRACIFKELMHKHLDDKL